jgi:hypothetical protein
MDNHADGAFFPPVHTMGAWFGSPASWATLPVAALAVLAAGCGSAVDDRAGSVEVRDSAGVAFVVNSGADHRLSLREVLRIGVVDGDPGLQFHVVRGIAVDSTGGMWVGDTNGLRYYDEAGGYIRSLGGIGEGPGEAATGYREIWLTPGRVLATAYRTIQLFEADGEFLGSRLVFDKDQTIRPLGPADDAWLFLRKDTPPQTGRRFEMTWVVGRGPADDADFDSLFVVRGEPMVSNGFQTFFGSFFDGIPSIAADARGRIYYSHRSDYRVEVRSTDGRLVRVIERTVPRVQYDPAVRSDVEAGARSALAALAPQSLDDESVASMVADAMPPTDPAYLPALERILVAADGFIWVERADAHPRPGMRAIARRIGFVRSAWLDEWHAPLVFDLFGADGVYRGTIDLPSTFSPVAVTADRVYGTIRDELDVQYVVAFALQ